MEYPIKVLTAPCIGGPRDGELLSAFPIGRAIAAYGQRVTPGYYVVESIRGAIVWRFVNREIDEP
jgi:hypothetical protein